jgi:hypothetical protein
LEPGKSSGSSGKPPQIAPASYSAGKSYEKFPGTAWFKKKPKSSIITRMGKRLKDEGCSAYSIKPGPQWTSKDQASYKKWQKKLGYNDAKITGWPDKASWDKLEVPKAPKTTKT